MAQNGGIFAENNVVLIKKQSSTATTVTVMVKNKQTTTETYKVNYGSFEQDYIIPASDFVLITVTVNNNIRFKCKALTASINQPDMGWVELELMQYLPVKFAPFIITPVNKNY